MRTADEPDVVEAGRPAEREGVDVIVLQAPPAVAALAGLEPPLALPTRAAPHLTLHLGRDGVAAGWAAALPRLLDETLSLRVLGEHEVEAALEDLRRRPPGTDCPSASFALSCFSTKRRETVTCMRASSASSISTDSRGGGAGGGGKGQLLRPARPVRPGEPGQVHPGELEAPATRARLPGARPGPWPLGAPGMPV